VGTVVLLAEAISRNVGQPEVTYSLIDTNGGQDFRVNRTSGLIQTNATLDYTRTNVYLVCNSVSTAASITSLPPPTEGGYVFGSVCLSVYLFVCLFVCLSVCLSVRRITRKLVNGF